MTYNFPEENTMRTGSPDFFGDSSPSFNLSSRLSTSTSSSRNLTLSPRLGSTPPPTSLPENWNIVPQLLSQISRLQTQLENANTQILRASNQHSDQLQRIQQLMDEVYQLRSASISQTAHSGPPTSHHIQSLSTGAGPLAQHHRPANRPPGYPVEVLWTKDDCDNDPHTQTSRGNTSRPPIQSAIRDANGSRISKGTWRAIRATASMIVNEQLLTIRGRNSELLLKPGKRMLKSRHPKEWKNAVDLLEQQQPLLQLCAGNWKAEHVFGAVLRGISGDAAEEPDGFDLGNDDEEAVPGMASSSQTPRVNKRPRLQSTTVVASRSETPAPKRLRNETMTGTKTIAHTGGSQGQTAPAVQSIQLNNELSLKTKPVENEPNGHTHEDGNLVDIHLISVNSSFPGLKASIQSDNLHSIPHLDELLNMMEHPAPPSRNTNSPSSPQLLQFLTQLDVADPNTPDVSEDDTNEGWGHYQFRHGPDGFTYENISWEVVGNVDTACRLLAATIRTCKVARYLCFKRKIKTPSSYLADHYLGVIVMKLWEHWKPHASQPSEASPTPTITTTTTTTTTTAAATATTTSQTPTTNTQGNSEPTPATSTTNAGLRQLLNGLQRDELKQWADDHDLVVLPTGKRGPKRDDFVAAILLAPSSSTPTHDDVAKIKLARQPRT